MNPESPHQLTPEQQIEKLRALFTNSINSVLTNAINNPGPENNPGSEKKKDATDWWLTPMALSKLTPKQQTLYFALLAVEHLNHPRGPEEGCKLH